MYKKIVLIGAGSVVFSQELIVNLLKKSWRNKWHIALVDTDPNALQAISKLSAKIIDYLGVDAKLSYSTDRCEVLPGADYVVATVGVGGRRAWEQDVLIPRKYGIMQPLGDTTMVGGISRTMRMVPALVDIAKDIQKLCPKAFFFNYSNPMTTICRAIRKATDLDVIGLGHGTKRAITRFSKLTGYDSSKFTVYALGLNHMVFLYDVRYEGNDVFPLIKEKCSEIREMRNRYLKEGKEFDMEALTPMQPFVDELFETYGVFPAPSDGHLVEFFAERFADGNYYGKTLGIDAFPFERTINSGDKRYKEIESLANSDEPVDENYINNVVGEDEDLTNIMYSMEYDLQKVYTTANLPNNGVIPGLPDETILEMPAVATARGLLPIMVNGFPEKMNAVISKHAAIAELAVESAMTGDRNLFIEAVLLGGYINDRTKVANMVDELIKAHKEYLPQF